MKVQGIYTLTAPNGKVYVGQSWDIERRWSDYKNLRKESIGRKLYNSLKKYGSENFKYEVVLKMSQKVDQRVLDRFERSYWAYFEELGIGTLNLRECGGSRGKHSQESKDKISEANRGVPKSENHKQALSEAKLKKPTKYWKGKSFSEEHKQKLSKAKLGKTSNNTDKTRPYVTERYLRSFKVTIDGNTQEYMTTIQGLSDTLGISKKAVRRMIRTGKESKKLENIISINEC